MLAQHQCSLESSQEGEIERPVTWAHIWKLFMPNRSPDSLRSKEGEQQYLKYIELIKEKNLTNSQFVKTRILGFRNDPDYPMYFIKSIKMDDQIISIYATGELTYLRQFLANSQYFQRKKGIKEIRNFILLTKNNFPYDLSQNIYHWVVWTKKPHSNEFIERALKGIILDNLQIKIYENLPKNKSVPEICHKQLFLRRKGSEDYL